MFAELALDSDGTRAAIREPIFLDPNADLVARATAFGGTDHPDELTYARLHAENTPRAMTSLAALERSRADDRRDRFAMKNVGDERRRRIHARQPNA